MIPAFQMPSVVNPFETFSRNNFPDFDSCWENFTTQNAFQYLGQSRIIIESPAKWRVSSPGSLIEGEEEDDISIFSYITLGGSSSASSFSLEEGRPVGNEDDDVHDPEGIPSCSHPDSVTPPRRVEDPPSAGMLPVPDDGAIIIDGSPAVSQTIAAYADPPLHNDLGMNTQKTDKRSILEHELRFKLEEAQSHIAAVNVRASQWFPSRPDFAGLVKEGDHHQNCFAYFRPYI